MNTFNPPFLTDDEEKLERLLGWQWRKYTPMTFYDYSTGVGNTVIEYGDYRLADEITFLSCVAIRKYT